MCQKGEPFDTFFLQGPEVIIMSYFISHIGVIFLAACFIAVCAVAWWYLTDKNARLKRQRAEARKAAAAAAAVAERKKAEKENGQDPEAE